MSLRFVGRSQGGDARGTLPVGASGWGGILSSQTLRETSGGGHEVTILPPPLSSLVFSVIHHFGFSQLGAVRKAQKGGQRQLSSSKLVIFSFCGCSVLFSQERLKKKNLHKQRHQKQPYFFKAEFQKTEETRPLSN